MPFTTGPIVPGLALACAIIVYFKRSKKLPLPPGPPSLPILGNITRLPLENTWLHFVEFKKTYGDVAMFHGLGNHILVVNSLKTMQEFFDSRHAIYSDRPVMVMVGELAGVSRMISLLQYGNEWRNQRKVARVALSPTAVSEYHTLVKESARSLCKNISQQPDAFFAHIKLATGRIILSSTYGIEPESAVETEFIGDAESVMEWVTVNAVPGKHLCDMFPWMAHLPSWLSFQRSARHGKELVDRILYKPYDYVKQQMAAGTALPSATQRLIDESQEGMTKEWENAIRGSTGMMYGAGSETMYSIILVFILAMTLHPDKQTKAQAELDSVIGPHRLPDVSDVDQLPYINALIKEVMRWYPVVPLGVPRRLREDDVYQGYLIPKDTTVIPNVWALSREPNNKYSPEEFIPERFLDAQQPVIDPSIWAFGFGRRICPGKLLAERSLFIIISSLLACFRIEQIPNQPPNPTFRPYRLTSFPSEFPCSFEPRRDIE